MSPSLAHGARMVPMITTMQNYKNIIGFIKGLNITYSALIVHGCSTDF
jgi:hypothetical protein